jgi:glutamine cyclotransferase
MRSESLLPSSMFSDDGDQMNQIIDAEKVSGSAVARLISRERVVRIMSLEGRMVAMDAPSGLGRECSDAKF